MNASATIALFPVGPSRPISDPRQERLVEALAEYHGAVDAGEPPDREVFLQKYADVRDELLGYLDSFELFRAAAPQLQSGSAMPDNAPPERATLGDFRILRELGRGGMGVVYEAEQLSLGRHVALKVLPFAAMLDKQQLNRFKNEARAAATLDHPNIVAIHSVGSERGVHYYAMQLVEGQSLAQAIEEKRRAQSEKRGQLGGRGQGEGGREELTSSSSDVEIRPSAIETVAAALSTLPDFSSSEYFRAIAKLGIQAAEALDHAHQNGILHRDIKPANLMVDDAGKLWVTDFGLARIEQDAGMTMTGDILGTLRYMSPEQALAKRVVVDHRSDIYSLGVTLYELLTLEPAFAGEDRQELLRQIAFEEPRKPRQVNRQIPVDLETIVLKAMEKNPGDRYATAQEIAEDLRRFTSYEPIKAKPQGLVGRGLKWARRHQPAVWSLAITFSMTTLVVAASVGAMSHDRAARQLVTDATARVAMDEATRLIEESKWSEALAAVNRANDVLAVSRQSGSMVAHVHELRSDIEIARRLEEIRVADQEPMYAFRNLHKVQFDALYREVLCKEFKIDLEPGEGAERIRNRSICLHVARALDHWAYNSDDWQWITDIARAVDPDPWRNRLRDLRGLKPEDRKAELLALFASAGNEVLEPATAVVFARMLTKAVARPEAIQVLAATQQKYPRSYEVSYELASAYEELHPPDFDQAIRYYTAAIAVQPERSLLHVCLAQALGKKFLHNEAISAYREAIRLDPQFAEAHHGLGVQLTQKGLKNEGLHHFREALRLHGDVRPDDWNALRSRVNMRRSLGQYDEALANVQQVRALRPHDAEVHYLLGNVLREVGRKEEAMDAWREAIRLDPNLGSAHNNLGMGLVRRGNYNEAVPHLREAVRLNQDGESTLKGHRALWEVYFHQGDFDQALVEIRQAELIRPADSTSRVLKGATLRCLGRHNEGVHEFQEAVRLDPASATIYFELAWHYGTCSDPTLRDPEQALKFAKQAVELAPEHPSPFGVLGIALYRAGDYTAATETLLKSVGRTDTSYAHFFLALAQWQLGEHDAARQWYREGVEWMEKYRIINIESMRFRAEAEELLSMGDGNNAESSKTLEASPGEIVNVVPEHFEKAGPR